MARLLQEARFQHRLAGSTAAAVGLDRHKTNRPKQATASLIRRVNSSGENSGTSPKSESDGRQQKMDAAYSGPSSLVEVYGPLGHIHNHY
jgi:hypothetical protein